MYFNVYLIKIGKTFKDVITIIVTSAPPLWIFNEVINILKILNKNVFLIEINIVYHLEAIIPNI